MTMTMDSTIINFEVTLSAWEATATATSTKQKENDDIFSSSTSTANSKSESSSSTTSTNSSRRRTTIFDSTVTTSMLADDALFAWMKVFLLYGAKCIP